MKILAGTEAISPSRLRTRQPPQEPKQGERRLRAWRRNIENYGAGQDGTRMTRGTDALVVGNASRLTPLERACDVGAVLDGVQDESRHEATTQ